MNKEVLKLLIQILIIVFFLVISLILVNHFR